MRGKKVRNGQEGMLKQNDPELELTDDLNMVGGTVLSANFVEWLNLHTLCPEICMGFVASTNLITLYQIITYLDAFGVVCRVQQMVHVSGVCS